MPLEQLTHPDSIIIQEYRDVPLFPQYDHKHYTLVEDILDNCPFSICFYGKGVAIGFRGEKSFVKRCLNWAVNSGATKYDAKLSSSYFGDSYIDYVLCPKKDRFLNALKEQFRSEIILNNEVPPLIPFMAAEEDSDAIEAVYDDEAIENLAARRVEAFMHNEDCVVLEQFMSKGPISLGPVYECSKWVY